MPIPQGFDTALVLAGGNALGAYHLGACETLFAHGVFPARYVGASIGAVTAAILLGNPAETRLDQLRAFWSQAAQADFPGVRYLPDYLQAQIGNNYAIAAMLGGRPGLFTGRWPGIWSALPFMPPDVAVRDHRPLRRTLERLIDFDRLNSGPERLDIVATDVETGEDVWFSTATDGISADHLLAATALPPLFAPIECTGHLLCDAGLSNNLPVDRVLQGVLRRPTLCLAVDLFAVRANPPATLDETVTRAQDLVFAIQSRRQIASLIRERQLIREHDPASPSAVLARIAYGAERGERALKALNFTRAALARRAAQGRADMAHLLKTLDTAPRNEALAYVAPDNEPEHSKDVSVAGSVLQLPQPLPLKIK